MYLYDVMIQILESEIGRGMYCWGRRGEIVTDQANPEEWIRKHETTATNGDRAVAYYRKLVAKGISPIRAFDCSGFMYWAGKQCGALKSRRSAQGIYDICTKISRREVKRGDFVFRYSDDAKKITHVGMYTGDAHVVECMGRDVGVTKTTNLDKDFNRYGRLPILQTVVAVPEEPEPTHQLTEYVRVLGGSVRVREKGSVLGAKLFTAHRGQEFPLVGRADSGWYKIDVGGTYGYISNKPKYTEVISR